MKNNIIFDNAAIDRLMKIANIKQEKYDEWLINETNLSKEKEKILSFGRVTLSSLKKVVNIELRYNKIKFDNWFNYKYKLEEEENIFLENLIEKNRLYLTLYNEQTLTIKFIGLVLNKVNFIKKDIKDWYGYKIKCKLNNYILNGEPDFTVATGIEEPETPYFFLQEYKRSVNPTGNPEFQVLAAMLTAMTLNKTNKIIGGYIIGRYWNFIILEKLENEKYEYFVSDGFDCLKFDDLKQIYINLQAVKFLYCKL